MKSMIQSVKGTRDFYPEEMALRSWLYQTIREVSESYGYQEYEGPFLERIDLYAAKSGEELVKEQAFVFADRGGDEITLRPELTPTLARMVAQRQRELAYPLRWWSFGPFWRYERPQKGRTREFFQWNIDVIGVNSAETDAELVSICAKFFQKVGLTAKDVVILVNNRRLMDAALVEIGIGSDLKKNVFRLIDRRDKMPPADWEAYAAELGLNAAQFSGLKDLLADRDLWKKSDEMRRVFAVLESMGLGDYIQFDAQTIRGLEYYTGIVFEARTREREGRAILGGGHYDNLVSDVGGELLPGVGFAMGDVMISVLLRELGKLPVLSVSPARVLVTVFDESRLLKSFVLADQLRSAGLAVINSTEAVKLPKQLKLADRLGIRFAVIQGPDESERNEVTIKDLVERTQVTVSETEMVAKIQQMLA